MRAGLDAVIAEESWKNAAFSAGNLSELTLALGDVVGAVQSAEKSVELADRSGNAHPQILRRATLADALHHAGRWKESEALFGEAERRLREWRPRYIRLYSLQGYQYCDLVLSRGEPEDGSALVGVGAAYREASMKVRERAEYGVEIARRNRRLLDIALDHLALGRAYLGLALTEPDRSADVRLALEHLDRAVDGLRKAGEEEFVARGLLARAALRPLSADPDGAAADLREAQEIAERGSMRLHEADAHLEWTRLHLDLDDRAAARRHLDRARELVRSCGYGRREREVRWLEGRVGDGG